MSFWVLYFIALLPFVVGGVLHLLDKNNVTWQEWVINSVICLVLAAACHGIAVVGSTSDTETWSGQVTKVVHVGAWVESYSIKHTVHHSSGTGKNKVTWTTTYRTYHTRNHPDEYNVYTNLPGCTFETSREGYLSIREQLGNIIVDVKGHRSTWSDDSRMRSGDPYDHITQNTSNAVIPINKDYSFDNRVKAASTIFSFSKLPDKIDLPTYPTHTSYFTSNRLLGTAKSINIRTFDEFNSRIGPSKKVNTVLVGLGNKSSAYGKWLEAKWLGGKKNDLVIVWGGDNSKPDWVYAFSWTDKKTVLRNIENLVTENGISESVLPLIEQEIVSNYKLKNWHDFDYISIPVSTNWVIGFTIFMVISQIGILWWIKNNDVVLSKTFNSQYNRYVKR